MYLPIVHLHAFVVSICRSLPVGYFFPSFFWFDGRLDNPCCCVCLLPGILSLSPSLSLCLSPLYFYLIVLLRTSLSQIATCIWLIVPPLTNGMSPVPMWVSGFFCFCFVLFFFYVHCSTGRSREPQRNRLTIAHTSDFFFVFSFVNCLLSDTVASLPFSLKYYLLFFRFCCWTPCL